MKMNDKQYTLQETTVQDISVNPMFENLDIDFIPILGEKSEREYFRSDMGQRDIARVKSRDMWRNSWAGESFVRENARQMRDDEVDAAITEYFKLTPGSEIDYYQIQDELRKQRDVYYTGDYEVLTRISMT